MKISIGTAQFGSKYGVSNTFGKTKISEIKKIIGLSIKSKFNFIYFINFIS